MPKRTKSKRQARIERMERPYIVHGRSRVAERMAIDDRSDEEPEVPEIYRSFEAPMDVAPADADADVPHPDAARIAAELGLDGSDDDGGGDEEHAGDHHGTAFVIRAGVRVTRGSILQRHKMEWKRLREELRALRSDSRKYNPHVLADKKEKRRIALTIKARTAEEKTRQEEELAEFDREYARSQSALANCAPGDGAGAGMMFESSGGAEMTRADGPGAGAAEPAAPMIARSGASGSRGGGGAGKGGKSGGNFKFTHRSMQHDAMALVAMEAADAEMDL